MMMPTERVPFHNGLVHDSGVIVRKIAAREFEVAFESEDELRAEHAANLVHRGLRLVTAEQIAPFTPVVLELRLEGRGSAKVKATVVAPLPGALALTIEAAPAALLKTLLAEPEPETQPEADETDNSGGEKDAANLWDRVRALSHLERRMLAPKATRQERAILTQDSDSVVLNALLKNPRITIDEVVRVAKSAFITYQTVDVMMKTTQWNSNLDLRVALIHNAKTPQTFCMRILPTLPESEVRVISRGAATSMALKTAALKILQSR
jgi:hypothetical protein